MRVTRSFLLLLAVARCAGGAPRQPPAYVQKPPPGQVQPSIDTMTYGAPAPAYQPSYAYQPGYGAPSATTYAYPANAACTGLLTCFNQAAPSAYPAGPGYAYQAARRYAYPAAPSPAPAPAVAPAPAISAQSPYTLESGD